MSAVCIWSTEKDWMMKRPQHLHPDPKMISTPGGIMVADVPAAVCCTPLGWARVPRGRRSQVSMLVLHQVGQEAPGLQ
jgi:hypothetical protein